MARITLTKIESFAFDDRLVWRESEKEEWLRGHRVVRTATKWRLQAPGSRTTLGFASTIVLRRGSGGCSWFPGAGCNQTEIQEPVSEEIFAVRQENEDSSTEDTLKTMIQVCVTA